MAAVAGNAGAADLRVFRLPPEPVNDAIVRFATQGRVSVGGFPIAGCAGRSRVTFGVMAPADALRRLLPPGCGFDPVGPAAFRIVARRSTPTPASGAPAAQLGDAQVAVDEIVVTAEKRSEPLRGSAFAVSAVSGDEVRRLGGRSFSDIALQIAGVTVTNLGSGRNKIFVRGMSDGAFTGKTQSTVGLYLDDVPITYSAPDPDLRLADVAQVEVLRGPQGTLYGSGSIGGIVRIVTVKPDPVAFAASATVEAAGTRHGEASNGVEAMLNMPVGRHAAVRLVGYRDRRGGYIDNPELGLSDVNHGERSGVRASALANLPAGWQVQASYAHQSINTADSQYVQPPSRAFSRDAAVREPHDNDFTVVGLTAARQGERADLKLSAAFIDHSIDSRYDATGGLGAVGPAAFDESRSVDLWVGEAVLTSAGGGDTRWLAGLFASRAKDFDDTLLTEISGARPPRSAYSRRDQLSEAAVYGEIAHDLTSRLSISAGGRLFSTHQTTRMDGFGLARAPIGMIRGEIDKTGFTPKLRVSFTPRPDIVVYAQIQEGYRAGGFNLPPAADGASLAVASAPFREDRLRSYELGAEAPLLHRTLTLRAAAFYAQWSKLQTDQFLASGLPATVNIGDGKNLGLEAEAAWRPDSHWQVRGNLLVGDPQITRPSNAFPAAADIGLPGVTSLMGSVDVRYRWLLSDRIQAELSAQYGYIGHSYLSFDGAMASRMGGYGVGRLAARLDAAPWRIEAYVDNVTDQAANSFAFGSPFDRARVAQTPLRPRTFGVAITRQFGARHESDGR